jgi:hypothetical protein
MRRRRDWWAELAGPATARDALVVFERRAPAA